GDFALAPQALGPGGAPGELVEHWPPALASQGDGAAAPLAIPGRMPRLPMRLFGVAGAATAVAVISDTASAPPAVVAIAAAAFVVPRLTWVAITGTAVALLSSIDPAAAALAAISIVSPLLLLATRPSLWPAGGLAAGLAVIGAAGAWPALAALAPRAWTRLGLAIHGALVAAVTALAIRTPGLDAPPGSLAEIGVNFMLPTAGIWAVAALLLGIVVRGRTLAADVTAAAAWAGAVGGAMAGAHVADPSAQLWAGPAVAALLVVAARAALREHDRARIAPR
ncbi:MAG: hypothetical protein QM679_05110, partial [Patulibacter sp.]